MTQAVVQAVFLAVPVDVVGYAWMNYSLCICPAVCAVILLSMKMKYRCTVSPFYTSPTWLHVFWSGFCVERHRQFRSALLTNSHDSRYHMDHARQSVAKRVLSSSSSTAATFSLTGAD
jgi:hypothetical protein